MIATVPRSALIENTRPRLVLGGSPGQLRVLNSSRRFTTVFANRRWGKTICAELRVLKETAKRAPEEEALIWWVAPTYRQSKRPFRDLARALRQIGNLKRLSRGEMTLETNTGWIIEFRSADNPDNLLGEGLYGLVGDEIAIWADAVYDECLSPMLADHEGWFMGIGSARGKRGFGYRLYVMGQDSANVNYASFLFTLADAEFITPAEKARLQLEMPKRAFRQEFLTEFLDDGGAIFESIRERRRVPIQGESEGIGADWAKKVDYTVFTAIGTRSGAIKDVLRLRHGIPYQLQVDALVEFCAVRKAKGAPYLYLCHDQTGVGEALDDLLKERRGKLPSFEGVVLTNANKEELVQEAAAAFESNQLGWVPDKDPLWQDEDYRMSVLEHEQFTTQLTERGRVTYGAPDGAHDDCVMSEVLANRARRVVKVVGTPRLSFL